MAPLTGFVVAAGLLAAATTTERRQAAEQRLADARTARTAALARVGAPFEVVAESHQPDVLREMVGMGLGWTVLPVAQAESGAHPLTPARVKPLAQRHLVLVDDVLMTGRTIRAVSARGGARVSPGCRLPRFAAPPPGTDPGRLGTAFPGSDSSLGRTRTLY